MSDLEPSVDRLARESEFSGIVRLEGMDAGMSFRSAHDPDADLTHTVISNTSDGAWPLTRHLDEVLMS